jgi:hypothetical protein
MLQPILCHSTQNSFYRSGHTSLKYVLLAIVFLVLGYAISMFLPLSTFGLDGLQGEIDQYLAPKPEDLTEQTATIPVTITYAQGSFLTESDFLSIPGIIKPLGFRFGVPLDVSAADELIDRLQSHLPAAKSRYVTGNNKQAVVVVGGNFGDRDDAIKALRDIQPLIKERIQIIYLPDCAVANQADDEGFICAPPPPEETPADPVPAT